MSGRRWGQTGPIWSTVLMSSQGAGARVGANLLGKDFLRSGKNTYWFGQNLFFEERLKREILKKY